MELKDVRGIGVKSLEYFNNDGILTIEDALYTYPKSYTIYEIKNDFVFSGEYLCISGILDSNPVFLKYRRNVNSIIFYIIVNNYKVKCVIFSSDYLRYKLYKGVKVILYGRFKKENKEFVVQNIFFDDFNIKIETDYKLKNVKNSMMTKVIKNIFTHGYTFNDDLPSELIDKYKLLPLSKYVYTSHFPETINDYIQIGRRRKYEEFFWYSVSLELLKLTRKSKSKLDRNINYNLIDLFIKSLSYSLTLDQEKCIGIIKEDITANYPMNRLVQGDVGCGKSIIAYISALMLVSAGYQAVIMVPTEVLANQQYENIKKLLSGFNLSIELLTSSIKSKDKADILYRLMNNRVNIIIGTHALLEENVRFYKLGIVIIDEQHRFGVKQRSNLISKFPGVDCLYLTATPIPRTLGLTSFGDLDISSIHTMPNNRKNIVTYLYNYSDLDKLSRVLLEHIELGEQIYIVVPLVLENTEIDAIDINEAYQYFSKALPNIELGIIHGKLKSSEKTRIMNDFKIGKIKALISTTVIEVGVDVKNATIMVILDANRYGLAQIHQLRGRVGRSDKQSYCYLVSKHHNERLEILARTSDGFEIAMEDFKLRGPGDYLGDKQSGYYSLNYANFENDFKIWSCAKEDGEIYAHRFLNENSKNKRFLEILALNKSQKNKIN